MSLPEALNKCLCDLTRHCEVLCAEKKALLAENRALKHNLTASSAVETLQDAEEYQEFWPVIPPGTVERTELIKSECEEQSQRDQRHVKIGFVPPTPAGDPPSVSAHVLDPGRVARPQRAVSLSSARLTRSGERVDEKQSTAQKVVGAVDTLATKRLKLRSGERADEKPSTTQKVVAAVDTLATKRLKLLPAQLKSKTFVEDHNAGLFDDFQTLTTLFLGRSRTNRSLLWRFANSTGFKCVCNILIIVNSILIGIYIDALVEREFRRMDSEAHIEESLLDSIVGLTHVDTLFAYWFTIELLVRVAADRRAFIVGEDRYWNMFDVVLVSIAVAEEFSPTILNLSFMRIIRVFRLVRVVRIIRTVAIFRSLRTMLFSMLSSFVNLTWALLLITIVIYIFAIIFLNAIVNYVESTRQHGGDLAIALSMKTNFGSVFEAMVSLFCAVTGGNDWMMYGELLRHLGEQYFLLFMFYVYFIVIGLLNVVTGIFVDSAVCTRTDDEIVECFTDNQRRVQAEVKRIFKHADSDKSGTLTYQELENHLHNSWVKAYFAGIDMDASEAGSMFTIMDLDGSGEVDVDEFVDGCLKMKGYAKSIDVMAMMYDASKNSERLDEFCRQTQENMRYIEEMLHRMTNHPPPNCSDSMV
jgi:voltage-gated sodium channel